MKKLAFCLALLLFAKTAHAQQLQILQLGYQEPITRILDLDTDPDGNIYYMGCFKGILMINDQEIEVGKGGDDLFLAKTDSTGNLIWHKCYGGQYNETPNPQSNGYSPKLIRYKNGAIHVIWPMLTQYAEMETFINNDLPYVSLFASYSSTDGSLNWFHTADFMLDEILDGGDAWYLTGTNSFGESTLAAISYDDSIIAEGMPVGTNTYRVCPLVKTDLQGDILWTKKIYDETRNRPYRKFICSGDRFYFHTQKSKIKLQIGGTLLMNDTLSTYIVKTDTSLHTIRYGKIWTGMSGNAYLSVDHDTVYVVHANIPSSGSQVYSLHTFDAELHHLDTEELFSDSQFRDSGNLDNKLGLVHFAVRNGIMLGIEVFLGLNNTGLPDDSIRMAEVALFKDHKRTINLPGSSKGYVIRYNLRTKEIASRELGNFSLTPYISSNYVRGGISGNSYHFFLATDNTWNPWIVNSQTLDVEKGIIHPWADQADFTRMIKYLSDGSRVVLGIANGRTSLDPPGDVPPGNLFFAGVGQNDEILWYKRPLCTMSASSINSTRIIGDCLFSYVLFSSSRNGSLPDYIELDGKRITSNEALKILFMIDKEGNAEMIDLATLLPGGVYAFYPIDTASALVASGFTTPSPLVIGNKTFPSDRGMYIARMDMESHTLTNAIKFISQGNYQFNPSSGMDILDYDTVTNSYVYKTGLMSLDPLATFLVHNGNTYLDKNIEFIGSETQNPLYYSVFLKGDFNTVTQAVQIGPSQLSSQLIPSFCLMTSRIAFLYTSSQAGKVYYNGTQIGNDDLLYFMGLINEEGELAIWKKWETEQKGYLGLARCDNINGVGYLSMGINKPLSIESFEVPAIGGLGDGLIVQFDDSLGIGKGYQLSSLLGDAVYGIDFYIDSLMSIAYSSQGVPVLVEIDGGGSTKSLTGKLPENGLKELEIRPEDLEEDAFLAQAEMVCDKHLWYRDSDQDGYGNPDIWINQCYRPSGFSANNLDCNDQLASIEPCPTGTENPEQDPDFLSIFPNPSTGQVQVRQAVRTGDDLTISIYTCTGNKVFEKVYPPLEVYRLDISLFPEGIYILKAGSGRMNTIQKLVLHK